MKLIRWTKEQKELFNKLAPELGNEELSELLGIPVKNVQYRRGTFAIKKCNRGKYPRLFIQYVQENYRTSTDREMSIALIQLFPDIPLTENSLKMLRQRLKCKRTEAETQLLIDRLNMDGTYRHAPYRKNGDILYRSYRYERRWIVWVEGKYVLLEKWLWEQEYGPIPPKKRVVIIDPTRVDAQTPVTLDNIELRDFSRIVSFDIATIVDWGYIETIGGEAISELKEILGEVLALNVQLQKEIKAKQHGAAKGVTSDKWMETPPTKND